MTPKNLKDIRRGVQKYHELITSIPDIKCGKCGIVYSVSNIHSPKTTEDICYLCEIETKKELANNEWIKELREKAETRVFKKFYCYAQNKTVNCKAPYSCHEFCHVYKEDKT